MPKYFKHEDLFKTMRGLKLYYPIYFNGLLLIRLKHIIRNVVDVKW